MGQKFEQGQRFDGIPYEPQGTERTMFAEMLRAKIIEDLGGLKSIVRFDGRERFKVPVPNGEQLLNCIRLSEDYGDAHLNYRDIRVTVSIPCNHPSSERIGDTPYRMTFRFQLHVIEQKKTEITPKKNSTKIIGISACVLISIGALLWQYLPENIIEKSRESLRRCYDFIDGIPSGKTDQSQPEQPPTPPIDPWNALR